MLFLHVQYFQKRDKFFGTREHSLKKQSKNYWLGYFYELFKLLNYFVYLLEAKYIKSFIKRVNEEKWCLDFQDFQDFLAQYSLEIVLPYNGFEDAFNLVYEHT